MKLFTMIFGAALAMGSTLFAQNFSDRMTVKLPSPVVVNGVTIPAGEASIQVIRNAGSMLLAVRSDSGVTACVMASRAVSEENVNEPRLVLDQKDGVYRLNRIVMPDNSALQVSDLQ